ncbi:cytochrome P450 [Cristinia sonorae]|uniref:Cytochrome P450 n=1 Tax=Cristinia sonorae TaxID=1940300 RepID=A0A8K0UMD3_9AGAR|nr:cytochrome P450 [Cristinia sonorae]
MPVTLTDVALTASAIIAARWLYQKSSAQSQHHPPGPPGLPLVGNVMDMPAEEAWLVYKRWSDQYSSDVIRLNVLGTNIIVVNSFEAAADLFDKKSTIYNDRPHMTMLYDLIGFGWAVAFTPYGDRWRDMRKAFHQDFNPDSAKQFNEIEVKAVHELLQRLIQKPSGFMEHARHMAGRIIMRSAYGIDIQPHDDPYIEIGEKSLQALSASTNAGSYLVDMMPILRYVPYWFPGANFQVQAKNWRPWVSAMLHDPFENIKKRMHTGDAPECAATALLEDLDKIDNTDRKNYMESVIRTTLGSMYAGGADTTVSALGTFILAMLLHPEVQERARAQIDAVVGTDGLPSFSDRPFLPYIDAVMNETLRWKPVLHLDIPHLLTKDDVYKGYFIPKGSVIVGNTWAVLHDERAYPEPSKFNPDRFMLNGELNPDVRDPDAVFGFGRRICPGRFMAKESMWIAMAMILAALDIRPVKNNKGKDIIPVVEYEPGLVAYPKPFEVDIQPRSPEHAALIAEFV